MKKVNVLTAFLSLLVLLTSCAGPLPGAGGTFTLKVTLAQGAAGRTVVPDLGDAVKSYRLNLTSRSGHVPREMVSQGSTLTFEGLHAGTWDLQGQALDAEGTVLAEKTLTGQILAASGSLDLTLALDPTVRTGTGTLDLILEWPESSGVDGLTVSLLAGEASVADPQPTVTIPTFVAGSSRTAYILRTDLAAGTYSLVLKFTRAGKDAGTFREAVNVTADLITRLWIDPADGKLVTVRSFTPGDFLGAQTSLAGLAVSGVLTTDFTFASETTNYIIPQVPTTKPLTFTATQGMPGQNLEYQWNSEETWQTGVFGVLSRPLTLRAGDNKLTLKVTAPDRINFKTYTLTFHWTPSFVSPTGMEMVQVDGGTFQRDADAANLSTVDTFLMGRYEVTQEQWLEVMGYNPNALQYPDSVGVNFPASDITWFDAVEFCNKLSEKEGLSPVYTITNRSPATGYPVASATVNFNLSATGYRLPTNNEWIWAALGGERDSITTNISGGINRGGWEKDFAGYNGTNSVVDYALLSSAIPRTVGYKRPNELGIYDLSGNAQEMVYERTSAMVTGPVRNLFGVQPSSGRYYVGGTCFSAPEHFTQLGIGSYDNFTNFGYFTIGFRVARNTSPLYKVTYSAAGADAEKSFTLAYNAEDTVTVLGNAAGLENFTYEVTGWTVDGTETDYRPGDTFVMGTKNVILHPRWSITTIPVQGGTFPQTNGPTTFNHTISPFRMGKYEVTYDQWYKVYQWAGTKGYTISLPGREGNDGTIGAAPSVGGAKNEPATSMNWRDALVWCNALSEMEGLTPVYYTDAAFTNPLKVSTDAAVVDSTQGSQDNPYVKWNADGYRLPTEGEMNYVAAYKDGSSWTPFDYASGATANYDNAAETESVAWILTNSLSSTHEVGTKAPNALGFYDISGNVWECIWDAQESYTTEAKSDYRGGVLGQYRSIYGGAFDSGAILTQIGHRQNRNPWDQQIHLGFRIVRGVGAEN